MPTLDWIGKSKVVNHHLDVPYKVLERQYSFDKDGKHAEDNEYDHSRRQSGSVEVAAAAV